MVSKKECCCSDSIFLIYSCSGGSDVGKLADEVARGLSSKSNGKMSCVSALGAHISGFEASAKSATKNIVIDGCKMSCARKILEHLGLKNISCYVLTDMGYLKGKTRVNKKIIDEVINKIYSSKNYQKNIENVNSCC